ncbi:NUDIX domain-containing protein [bacterium]|nr:NUDIX domain-containing protein [bacterium]
MRQNYELYLPSGRLIWSANPPAFPHRALSAPEQDLLVADFEEFMSPPRVGALWISTADPDADSQTLLTQHHPIEAAGGLVQNPSGDVLLIHRLGHWDLPKGKLEDGEHPEDAALREVEEECGLSGLQLIRALPKTWHTYIQDGHWRVKTTHWYHLFTADPRTPQPQESEGIDRVEWMAEAELLNHLPEAWPAIRALLEQFLDEAE